MLSGVLLHVVETTSPIYGALYLLAHLKIGSALHQMQDTIILLKHVGDCMVPEISDVVRLAPGSRVEGGGRQLDDRAVPHVPEVHDPARKIG